MRFSKATVPPKYNGKTPVATIRVDAEADDELAARGITHITIVIRHAYYDQKVPTPPGLHYAAFLPDAAVYERPKIGDFGEYPPRMGDCKSIEEAVGRAVMKDWLKP